MKKARTCIALQLPVYLEVRLLQQYIGEIKCSYGFVSNSEIMGFLYKYSLSDNPDPTLKEYGNWLAKQDIEKINNDYLKHNYRFMGKTIKYKNFTIVTELFDKYTKLIAFLNKKYPFRVNISYVILMLINAIIPGRNNTLEFTDDVKKEFLNELERDNEKIEDNK